MVPKPKELDMRNRTLRLVSAVTVVLVVVAAAGAQPPDRRGGRRGGGGFGPGPAFPPGGGIERALDDLKLSGTKKEKAEAAVKAHQEDVRKLMDLARAELLLKVQDVLSEQDVKQFKEALDRRPGPAGAGRRGGAARRGLSVDQIVERIMSFDKNKDGKITKDELPERMQGLIARGDTNKDGALDKDEVKKLATELARDGSFGDFDGRGGPGGRFGPGARGRGGRGGFGGPPDGFRPGGGPERALEGLNLSEKKRDQAEAAVRAHREEVRKLTDLARAGLLVKMQEILTKDEAKKFKEAVDRRPGFANRLGGGDGRRPGPAPSGAPRQGDLERKIDQLQRDLDTLRREIRR
jgi:hypothetical protein